MTDGLRFHASGNGKVIHDRDFVHDVVLAIAGDFCDDQDRIAYAAKLVDALNRQADSVTTPAPESNNAASVVEPVAWLLRPKMQRYPDRPMMRGIYMGARTAEELEVAAIDGDEYAPLYAHPPRAPLTDEQLDGIIQERWGDQLGAMRAAHREFARAVLAAADGGAK